MDDPPQWRQDQKEELMPIYEIQHEGNTYEVDAPSMELAAKSFAAPAPSPAKEEEPPVTLGGLNAAAGSGVANFAAGMAGLPRTIGTLGAQGIQAGANYLADAFGLPKDTRDLTRDGLVRLPTTEEARAAIATPYEPQNQAERRAETLGEFLPNALLPGGIVRRAANVVLPAAGTQAAKEAEAGPLAEAAAGLAGGAVAAKLGNAVERLGAKLPTLERGVANSLPDEAHAQYGAITSSAVGKPTTLNQREYIADEIAQHLHAQNIRPNNADETYKIIAEIRNPGRHPDVADLLTARQKLRNIHGGKDGEGASQASEVVDRVLDAYIPGIGKKLETADANWQALKTATELNEKIAKKTLQNASANSGLNLGNKLRQGATEILTNPNRAKYLTEGQKEALKKLSKGTVTQNAIRWAGNYLGGGGGLGALAATALGGHYLGGPESGLESGLGAAALGLALKRGYNRSIAKQAEAISNSVLAHSPYGRQIGSTYVPPATLSQSLGGGILSGLPAYRGILGQ